MAFRRQRPKKNYVWSQDASIWSSTGITIVEITLADGHDFGPEPAVGGTVIRQNWNLQRIVGDVVFGIDTTDLESSNPAVGIWMMVAWCLLIIDRDDTTAYDPETTEWSDEIVLAHGITDRFGWGTTANLLIGGGGVVQTQSAAFMASTRLHLDVKTNRKFSSDNKLSLFTKSTTQAALTRDPDDTYAAQSQIRILHKFP